MGKFYHSSHQEISRFQLSTDTVNSLPFCSTYISYTATVLKQFQFLSEPNI